MNDVIMHVHFWNVSYRPAKMISFKYFKHIKPSKEERIQSILPKPDGRLACLIPCSTIETAKSAIREIFTDARAPELSKLLYKSNITYY